MTGNFDYLLDIDLYKSFAQACHEAEMALAFSNDLAVSSARRAMELAIKWIYDVDKSMKDYTGDDNLASLMTNPSFKRRLANDKLLKVLHLIRDSGNKAIHGAANYDRHFAVMILNSLFEFMKFIDFTYRYRCHEKRIFREDLLPSMDDFIRKDQVEDLVKNLEKEDLNVHTDPEVKKTVAKNLEESKDKDEEFVLDPKSEAEARKYLIDINLELAGWKLGSTARTEELAVSMPNKSGTGFADYVLYGKDGSPLAVVEAKNTQRDPRVGSNQASLYCDGLAKKYDRRPFYFLTNGYKTYFVDDESQREVSGFYSQEDLQRLMDRRKLAKSLDTYQINADITNRTYQKEAIRATIDAFRENRRSALLVMATGTGKTRTAISIVDILTKANWASRILFLADRTALINQAKKNFANLLPAMSMANLTEAKRNKYENIRSNRMIFSTYQTMINSIDNLFDENGDRVFSVGYFDLIIIDEAHRSIYQRYKSIFDYFDAKIVGLTATPREDIDKNTYEIFNLEDGTPTYAYGMKEAVDAGFLVNYYSIEGRSNLMEEGIFREKLTDEEKEEFDKIVGPDSDIDYISGAAINNWLFNQDTVDGVINHFMKEGIRTSSGNDIGKTIVFAKNQRHADLIKERFDILYPQKGPDFARVISYDVEYAQDLIDKFSVKDSLPQIAISVNMLDTGIDVPEIVNLVFFKTIYSKIMFLQMIGRGTRLCPDLFGQGIDKTHFLIFDYGGNFERFDGDKNPTKATISKSLTARIFNARAKMALYLQDKKYTEYKAYLEEIIKEAAYKVKVLDDRAFDVRLHLEAVNKYRDIENWQNLKPNDLAILNEEVSDLIYPGKVDEMTQRFDLAMVNFQLDILEGVDSSKKLDVLKNTCYDLAQKSKTAKVREKMDTINEVLDESFGENLDIETIERIRKDIRDLIPLLIGKPRAIYYSTFIDHLEVNDPRPGDKEYHVEIIKNYRQKLEDYIKEKIKDDQVLQKIYKNEELTDEDFKKLEKILWEDLGDKKDYDEFFEGEPIYVLMRNLVGLDKKVIEENFSEIFDKYQLNNQQSAFIKTIMEYFEKNGYLDKKDMQKDPFKSIGSMSKVFSDDKSKIVSLVDKIDKLNRYNIKS